MPPKMNDITESMFQSMVIQYAQLRGWIVHHCRPARTKDGTWSTPISGDSGFPDLVLVRPPHCLFVELKTEKGKISDPQRTWRSGLENAGMDYNLWRPSDWEQIEKELF